MKAKLLFLSFLFGSYVVNASAQTTVTFGGQIDTQLGVRDQSKNYGFIHPQAPSSASTFRSRLHQYGIVNDTRIKVAFDTEMEEGAELGAVVILNADTSQTKFNNANYNKPGFTTYAFMESNVGRLEGGNTSGVYKSLKVSGANVARATGGIDGDVKYWWNPYIYHDGTDIKKGGVNSATNSPPRLVEKNFIQSPNLPSNYDEGGEANAAKVNYISPDVEGFRLGFSYIHDIAQFGSASRAQKVILRTLDEVSRTNVATLSAKDVDTSSQNFKEIYSGVLKFDQKFDQTSIMLSASGEVGTTKYFQDPQKNRFLKKHPLKAWEVGAGVEDSGFKLAGSYGNWGRSGEIKTLINDSCKKSDYWTLGGSYEENDTGVSITYFGSRKCGIDAIVGYDNVADTNPFSTYLLGSRALRKAKALEILSFGFDTKPAPGFMPYAELSFFRINEKNTTVTTAEAPTGNAFLRRDAAHNKKNNGFVIMSGVKVQF